MTIQSQVSVYLKKNTDAKLKDLEHNFPKINKKSLNSCYYRYKSTANNTAVTAVTNGKITMENMEALLVKQLKKKSDVNTLRLMVDFLKIKQQDKSELKEIDLEIFYKKAMED